MPLSTAQTDQLLRAISPQRVLFKHGLAYLEAYEVKAHLNRCFGFGGCGTDGAPSDIQEGCVTVSEEMADLRLRAKRMLADAARAANLPLDAVAKRFQAVHDVEIGRAHPAQIISTTQQIIDATNT